MIDEFLTIDNSTLNVLKYTVCTLLRHQYFEVLETSRHCDCPQHKAISAKRNNNNLSYRRGTARRSGSVEILSTSAQLYEKSHLTRLAIGEWLLEVWKLERFYKQLHCH